MTCLKFPYLHFYCLIFQYGTNNQLLNTLVICPKALQSLYITDCISMYLQVTKSSYCSSVLSYKKCSLCMHDEIQEIHISAKEYPGSRN